MDRPDPASLIAGQTTVSGQIRVLHRGGYSRKEIADLLNKRYQHVRNVLVDDERRAANTPLTSKPPLRSVTPGMAETSTPYVAQAPIKAGPVLGWLDIEPDGIVRLTDEMKRALGVGDGDRILVEVDGEGSLRVLSAQAAWTRAQEIVRPYLPKGVSVVDQFLADRRAAAERERTERENG